MRGISIGRFPKLDYAGGEAINTLCTNLTFFGASVSKIMFTSCHAKEGKSFLSMNTARTMAKLGKKVVLVDADLRRSTIASSFRFHYETAGKHPGLSHYLAGYAEQKDVVYETDIPGLRIVPVGRVVSNALPLLNSDRLSLLLDALSQEADYVFVDSAPVGTVIDAAQIARYCDGVVIVVNYNTVHRRELIEVKNQIEQTGKPILGTVLNAVELDSFINKKYYYKSYYSNSYSSYDIKDGKK